MPQKKSTTKRTSGVEKKAPPKVEPKRASPKARVRKVAAVVPTKPIHQAPSDEEIARRAYSLWESRGRPHGSPEEDWHRAKEQLGS